MTTTDPFTEAARAAAARRADLAAEPLDFEHGLIMKDFLAGAEWARDHLAAHDARVRRDAAREAVIQLRDHLARARGYDLIGPDGLDYYLSTHHPEENP